MNRLKKNMARQTSEVRRLYNQKVRMQNMIAEISRLTVRKKEFLNIRSVKNKIDALLEIDKLRKEMMISIENTDLRSVKVNTLKVISIQKDAELSDADLLEWSKPLDAKYKLLYRVASKP